MQHQAALALFRQRTSASACCRFHLHLKPVQCTARHSSGGCACQIRPYLHLPVYPLLPHEMSILQVYKPYLLMNKKRYAGLLWTNPDKFDKMDTKVCLPDIDTAVLSTAPYICMCQELSKDGPEKRYRYQDPHGCQTQKGSKGSECALAHHKISSLCCV